MFRNRPSPEHNPQRGPGGLQPALRPRHDLRAEDRRQRRLNPVIDAAGGEMRAASIELGDEIGDGDSDQIEVLGFVTDIGSAFEFTVGNQLVQGRGCGNM